MAVKVKASASEEGKLEPDESVVAKFLVDVKLDEEAHGEAEKCLDEMLGLPAMPSMTPTDPPFPKPICAIDRDPETKALKFVWHVEPDDVYSSRHYRKFEIWICSPNSGVPWTFCGEVTAAPLPMARTISCAEGGSATFLTVRGVDSRGCAGPCAVPCFFMKTDR